MTTKRTLAPPDVLGTYYYQYDVATDTTSWAGVGAGVGTLNHAALTANLGWTVSTHTGTAGKTAGFSGAGAAAEFQGVDTTHSPTFAALTVTAGIDAGVLATPMAAAHNFGGNFGLSGGQFQNWQAAPSKPGFNLQQWTAAYAVHDSTFELTLLSGLAQFICTRQVAGAAQVIFNPRPSDGTSTVVVKAFNTAGTTGHTKFELYTGAGALNHRLTSTGLHSYLCTQGGHVGIGTTTPTYILDVEDTLTSYVAEMRNLSATATADCLRLYIASSGGVAGGGNHFVDLNDSSANLGSIVGDGGVGVLYTTVSDRRLKTGIRDAGISASDVIDGLRVRRFGSRRNPGMGEKLGLITQEVHGVWPAAIVLGEPRNEQRRIVVADVSEQLEDDEGQPLPRAWEKQRMVVDQDEVAGLETPDLQVVSSRPVREEDPEYQYDLIDYGSFTPLLLLGHQEHRVQISELQATNNEQAQTIARMQEAITSLQAAVKALQP